MRNLLATVLTVGLTASASAQTTPQPAPPTTTYVTAAEITALAEKTAASRTPAQSYVLASVLKSPPYNLNLEYRIGRSPAAIHEAEGELFMVLDGSGLFTTGGRLIKGPDGSNAIEGGSARKVGKGDVFLIPHGVPHQLTQSDGPMVLLSLHLPVQAAPPQ